MDEQTGFAHWLWWRVFHLGACPVCHWRIDHPPQCWNRPSP